MLATSKLPTATQPASLVETAGLRGFLRQVLAVAAKDVRSEFRSKEVLSATLVFAVLVLFVFNFSFQGTSAQMKEKAPAMLWVAILLTAVLGLNHVFAKEKEQGAMEGFLLCPAERAALYFGKYLSALLFTLIMEAAVVVLFIVFTNQSGLFPLPLLALVLGTLGFLAVGTLFSAISVNTRTREMMLPILLLPVAVPVLLAGMQVTQMGLEGKPASEMLRWMGMLAVFDAIYLVLSPILFEYVVEELGP